MIESVRGGQNIGEMVNVEGVEMFVLGPADYSSSAGFAGQWQGPGIGEQLLQINSTIAAAGKCCGVIATSEANLIERRDQGFRMIGLGSDCGFLIRGLHTMLATAGSRSKNGCVADADVSHWPRLRRCPSHQNRSAPIAWK